MITGKVDLSWQWQDLWNPYGNYRLEKARILSPDYGGNRFSNDYAIIEIEPPIEEADMAKRGSTERPACQPKYDLRLDASFTIAGWGATGFSDYFVIK